MSPWDDRARAGLIRTGAVGDTAEHVDDLGAWPAMVVAVAAHSDPRLDLR